MLDAKLLKPLSCVLLRACYLLGLLRNEPPQVTYLHVKSNNGRFVSYIAFYWELEMWKFSLISDASILIISISWSSLLTQVKA